MSNRPILLGFHGPDGSTPALTPSGLADLVERIEDLSGVICHVAGGDAQVRLTFAAPPRPGSLIVPLVAELAGAINGTWPVFRELVSTGADLITLIFGANGLWDLWERRRGSKDNSDFPEPQRQLLANTSVRNAIDAVVDAAARSGCERVTIDVDGASFQVFPHRVRKVDPWLMGLVGSPSRPPVKEIRGSHSLVETEFRDRKVPVFVSHRVDQRSDTDEVLIVWLSSDTPPVDQTTSVRGRWATLDDLEDLDLHLRHFLRHKPFDRGSIQGIFIVESASVWR